MVVGRVEVRLSRALLALVGAATIAACAGESKHGDAGPSAGGGAGQSGTGGSSGGRAGSSASGGKSGSGGSGGKGGAGGSVASAGSGGTGGTVDCEALSEASETALDEARRCDPNAAEPECTLRVTVGVVCGEDQFVNREATDAVAAMKQADALYAMSCLTQGVTCGASRTALGANCTTEGLCETVYDNGGDGCRVDGVLYAHGTMHIDPSFGCTDCECDDGTLRCPEVGICPECPDGTTQAVGCAICGPSDECLASDYACFPSCASSGDCADEGAECLNHACVTGVCG